MDLYYVKEIGGRWSMMAADFRCREKALMAAAHCSKANGTRHEVWFVDSTEPDKSVLDAVFVSGTRLETCGGDWYSGCRKPKGHDGFHHPLGH